MGVDTVIKSIGYFLIPIYLYLMPKNDFGEFGYIYGVIILLPQIITLGLYVPQIKEFSSQEECKKKIFSSTILFVTIFAIIILTIFICSDFLEYIEIKIFKIESQVKLKGIVFTILIFTMTINLIIYSHVIALNNSKNIISYNIIKFITGNFFAISVLYLFEREPDTTLLRGYGLLIGDILLIVCTYFIFCYRYQKFAIDIKYLKKSLKIGLLIVPGAIASVISSMSDRYFINKYYGLSDVAEFNLAMQFLLPIQLIMISVQTVFTTEIYNEKSIKLALSKTKDLIKKLMYSFLIIIPILVSCSEMSKYLNIIPENYKETTELIIILSIGIVSLTMQQLPFNLFIKKNKAYLVTVLTILSALMTVFLGSISIHLYGTYGCIISSGFVNILILIISIKLIKGM